MGVAVEICLQAVVRLLFVNERSGDFLVQSAKLSQCGFSSPARVVYREFAKLQGAVARILIAFLVAFPFRRDSSIVFAADIC